MIWHAKRSSASSPYRIGAWGQRRELCFNSRLIIRTLLRHTRQGRVSTVVPRRTYFWLLLLRPTSRSCLDSYCPPDLRGIGGSSAPTPAWYLELRLRREGANRCVSVRARAQAASQLKLATVLILGTAWFSHCGALGFPCGCDPAAQGRMWHTHALLPMPSSSPCRSCFILIMFAQGTTSTTPSSTSEAGQALHVIYHSPFATLSFSPSSLLAPLTLSNCPAARNGPVFVCLFVLLDVNDCTHSVP